MNASADRLSDLSNGTKIIAVTGERDEIRSCNVRHNYRVQERVQTVLHRDLWTRSDKNARDRQLVIDPEIDSVLCRIDFDVGRENIQDHFRVFDEYRLSVCRQFWQEDFAWGVLDVIVQSRN